MAAADPPSGPRWALRVLALLAVLGPVRGARKTMSDLQPASLEQEASLEEAQARCEEGAVLAEGLPGGRFGNMSATRKCHTCVEIYGCKWCPLTQTCAASGFFGTGMFGKSCMRRPGLERVDKRVTTSADCDGRAAAWETTLSQSYGRGWLEDGRQADAEKCARWALEWPLTDGGYKEEGPEYDSDGRWNCLSALIREGVLASARAKQLPIYKKQASTKNVEVWNPALCSIIKVKEDRETCYVRGYAIDEFAKLRQRQASPNWKGPQDITARLAESMAKGPIKAFNPGAGKSGSGFGATADGKFKVKFGLKHTNKMDEVKNLMDLVLGNGGDPDAESLAEHFANNPNSLLNRQYALIKVAFGNIRTYAIVLDDAFYQMNDLVKIEQKRGAQIESTPYDLKGASRNQKEKSKGRTKMNGDFAVLENNRLDLSDEQCLSMRGAMQADVNFLNKYNIIDYSLLMMSIRRPQSRDALDCRSTPGEPYCLENENRMYTISIIDYLNNHNWFKGLESAVRACKFCGYGNSVMKYMKKICPTRDEQDFVEWISSEMARNFGSVHNAFAKFDEEKDDRLTEMELDMLFKSMRLSPQNTDKMLERIDKDHSGAVSYTEFMMALDVAR